MAGPIYVAGHRGLVGSAIVRVLEARGREVVTAAHADLDLRDQAATATFLADVKPAEVIVAAGTVGGILANASRPADFLYDNLMIHANVIEASRAVGVERLLYLGSSCIYPRLAEQPISEGQLLTGPLEPTNEAYAIAKIAGVKLCDAYRAQHGCRYISAMPTNLYGPGDRFDLESGHVLPALMRKCHEAAVEGRKEIEIWGTGSARREFLHVDDLAEACLFLLEHYDEAGPVNIGSGVEHSILDLATMLRDLIVPGAALVFDRSKPDGTPRKLLDTSRLTELGWSASIPLEIGLETTYRWFVENEAG